MLGKIGLRSMDVISDAGTITTSPSLSLYRSTRDFGLALGLITSWLVGIRYLRRGKRWEGVVLVAWGVALVGSGVGVPLYVRAVILNMQEDVLTHSQTLAVLSRALARVDLPESKRAILVQAYVDELHMSGADSDLESTARDQYQKEPSKTAARIRRLQETLEPLPGALARTAILWCGVWMLSALAGFLWPLRPTSDGLPPNHAMDPAANDRFEN